MTEKESPSILKEFKEPSQTLDQHLNGALFTFPKEKPILAIRPLTAEERAEADFRERTQRALLIADDNEIRTLLEHKASDEEIKQITRVLEAQFEAQAADDENSPYWFDSIEQVVERMKDRSAAEDPIERHLDRLRNIFIARTALCTPDGDPIDFDKQNERVQELAIAAANVYEREISVLPFELVLS